MPQRSSCELADIVKDHPGQQQIAVDAVMLRREVGDVQQRDDMLEQTADPGMMHALGGGRFAEGGGDFGIIEERPQQGLQVEIGKALDVGV